MRKLPIMTRYVSDGPGKMSLAYASGWDTSIFQMLLPVTSPSLRERRAKRGEGTTLSGDHLTLGALMKFSWLLLLTILLAVPLKANGQSVDWQSVIWREPQVRYLLTDMTLGGDTGLYRDYATKERDPDSREAIRLWDAGVRVVNAKAFERKWVANPHGKDGRVMRVVERGSNRTIRGDEVLLTSDTQFEQGKIRTLLALWTLGVDVAHDDKNRSDPNNVEALRRWDEGARVSNGDWFELIHSASDSRLVFRGGKHAVDPVHIRLNSDVAYPENNVRYFLADMSLGGSREFYFRTAEQAHEMGCQEAVIRLDGGVTVTNLDQFERKQVSGKTLITRKGGEQRISGQDVKLSTD